VDEEVKGITGAVAEIEGIGRVNFKSTLLNGEVVDVSWDDVKYAPGFQANIASTVVMTKKGITQVIIGNLCHFIYNGEEVMCARLDDSQWVMHIEPQYVNQINSIDDSNNNNKLWHQCYGHLSMRTLQKTKQHVVGMSLNTNDLQTCHDCIVSKIVRRSFPKSISPRKRRPLDLLHMDIDVINTPGRLGEKYVLFLTDDHSGFCFGFPIASRSGNIILECLQSALPYMERQSGNTLKAIRSDNAMEFTKGVSAAKLREIGIQQEYSLPYEHEQAGVAENTNWVIIDKACTMINLLGLDMKFWPDTICTAVFVANRSWHYGSKGIPYDKFTGRPVNVSMFCVFGSWCWTRKPAEFLTGHSKFDTQAILCRMIGYEQNGH
jgi:hypothetical protein